MVRPCIRFHVHLDSCPLDCSTQMTRGCQCVHCFIVLGREHSAPALRRRNNAICSSELKLPLLACWLPETRFRV